MMMKGKSSSHTHTLKCDFLSSLVSRMLTQGDVSMLHWEFLRESFSGPMGVAQPLAAFLILLMTEP